MNTATTDSYRLRVFDPRVRMWINLSHRYPSLDVAEKDATQYMSLGQYRIGYPRVAIYAGSKQVKVLDQTPRQAFDGLPIPPARAIPQPQIRTPAGLLHRLQVVKAAAAEHLPWQGLHRIMVVNPHGWIIDTDPLGGVIEWDELGNLYAKAGYPPSQYNTAIDANDWVVISTKSAQ